ncbi:MAG: tetratricopeptide repeat protein [Candidatus Hydrogenedens sp.]|nr:tetratricopeptide repeat protein [Candidatus Hydrogenedens sp.]
MPKFKISKCPWALLFILFIGILLRILYLQEARSQPWFVSPLYDPQYNDYWAKALVTGDWTLPPYVNDPEIRTTPHGRPPGYPYLLAIIYYLFGINPWAPRIVQFIFGILNIILSWFLVKRFGNQLLANIVALLVATFWGFIYFEAQLTYPVFAVFLLLVWSHLLLTWIQKPEKRKYPFFIGLVLGFLALFRPNGLLLISIFFLYLLKNIRFHKAYRYLCSCIILFLLGLIIPIVPCFVRNYVVSHDFVFISSYGGLNFYVGNHPNANGAEPRIPELQTWIGCDEWSCFDYPAIVRGLARSLGKESIKFSEANRYFYKTAFRYIIHHPKEWIILTLRKILLFWGPIEITNDTVPAWDKQTSFILKHLPSFPIYLSLFITGICLMVYRLFRGKPDISNSFLQILILSSLITFIYFLSVLPFFIAGRYRIPIMVFLFIISGWAISEFINLLKVKNWKGILAFLFIFFSSLFITRINLTGYQPSLSVWNFRQGVSASISGDYKTAKYFYKQSLKEDPENIFARINYSLTLSRLGRPSEGIYVLTNNFSSPLNTALEQNALGYLFETIGDFDKAKYHYAKAIIINPSFVLAHANIAHLYFNRYQYYEAKAHFEQLRKLQPTNPIVYFQLARIAEFMENKDEAIRLYKESVKLNASLYVAWNNLGWLYEQTGNTAEAQKAYKKAIELKPDYVLSRINYGNLLSSLGLYQQAQEQLETALKYEAENCEVFFLLGNVFVGLSKWDEAEEKYNKALKLCPEYANAWNNLGLVLSFSRRKEEAREKWLNAIILDEQLMESYINLIHSYEQQGECDKAITFTLKAFMLFPNSQEILSIWNGLNCFN